MGAAAQVIGNSRVHWTTETLPFINILAHIPQINRSSYVVIHWMVRSSEPHVSTLRLGYVLT